jgi:hypothetical protein
MFDPNLAFLLVQKLKSGPKGFILRVKAEILKNFSICPQVLINAELYGPKAENRIPSNLGGQFATIGEPMFQHLLIS